MSAIETLPPDQRAVLQLILKQGRGYADLSGLLRIDEAAVRARAHAGLDALAPGGAGAALSDERRAQIGDWLLGQQDPAARDETLQHLADSRAARRFARAVHEQLSPFAGDALPELPAAARNGAAPTAAAGPPVEPAEPADVSADAPGGTDALADAPADADAAASAPAPPAKPSGRPPTPPARSAPTRRAPEPRRSSKLGGALLIAGVAVLIVVVLVILINGGGDDDEPTASAPTPTSAQTQAQTRTGAARGASTEDDTIFLQQVNMRAPGGGDAPIGIAFFLVRDRRPVVAVQVDRIPANGADDVYAAWLRNPDSGRARFLGYFPGQVRGDQKFNLRAPLPNDAGRFPEIVISQESLDARTAPQQPSSIVLAGTIRVNRTG